MVSIKIGNLETDTNLENVNMKAANWVMLIQAKNCQRLPEDHHKLGKRRRKIPSPSLQKGAILPTS